MNFRAVLLLITLIHSIKAIKFNRPRILLPIFDEVRINFTLEVKDEGCFDFSLTSSGPPLIQIETIYEHDDDCATKVLITTLSRQDKTKKTAFVIARNLKTGEDARVDVILDKISKIIVHTTTRELYLEDAPEIFELKAQDETGNDFSVLEGVKFDWKIDRPQILRFLTFTESKYHQVPAEIEQFESTGKKGHMILLDGLKSGTAKVTVTLPYAEYSQVKPVEVDIAVLANLIIDPPEANILVGDSINFRVLQLKQGKLHEIVLNEQYTLEIEKSTIANMNSGLARGLKLGETNVILKDKNILDPKAQMPLPKATLRVVEADKIVLNLLPYYNWVTIEQENHEIAIDLYSKSEHKITLGDRHKIDSTFDTKLFKEAERNSNGTRIHGQALTAGTNRVTAKFGKNLEAHADMIIHGMISLTPKRTILPFDIENPVNQRIQYTAEGGDRNFIFTNNNSNILSISSSGLAETRHNRVKSLENSMILVKAALAKNVKLYKTAEILFYPPKELKILGYSDTALGDYVDLHIGLYAQPETGELLPFSSCENVQFVVELSKEIFTVSSADYDTPKVPGACRVIRLKADFVGTAQVSVAYKFYGSQQLKDEVTSTVYEPVITVNPSSNVVVLPIGSSRNVIYQHGPKRNFNMHSELVRNIKFAADITSVKEIQANFQENRFGVEILCKKVGETKVRVEIFNQINSQNFMKKSAVVETIVHCVKPRFIKLISSEHLKSSCPIDHNTMIHIRTNQRDLEIGIEVQDHQSRVLQNISSLVIDFELTSQSIEQLKSNFVFTREAEIDHIDGVAIPRRDLAHANFVETTTSQKIKATVTNYDMKILNKLNILPEQPVFGIANPANSKQLMTPKIESELDLFFFNTSPLSVSSISVFLSKNDVRLKLKQGSSFYDFKVRDTSIVDVKFDKSTADLIITPKKVGETFVEILDRCLETDASKLSISVVTFGRIELLSPNRVEKTKSIEAIAKFYDTHDDLIDFDYNDIGIYEISEKVVNEKIRIAMDRTFTGLKRGEIKYSIYGNELGDSKVTIFAGKDLISSSPSIVQVFSPIRLYPRNATILVGSFLEVSYQGGPSHRDDNEEGTIVYSVSNVDILGIDANVVEGLKIGKTRVTGKLITIDPHDGRQIILSEDQIIVNVIPLSRINIRAPLRNLKSGNEMPLTLWAEDVSPMVLGTLRNFEVKWTNDSPDVVDLTHVFENLGVIYSDKDSIAMRLKGRKPGRVKISASATHGKGTKLTTSIEITVFEGLELTSPKRIVHDPIIVPPRTSVPLKVNLDKTTFEVNDAHFGQSPVINVTRDGVVSSFDAIGTGLVVATCINSQKLDIPVEVKQIHYIMASVDAKSKLREIHSVLPKNLHLLISVSVYDDLGNKFSHNIADDILLELSKSKSASSLVHIKQNSSFSIELSREGSDIIAITLKDSSGMKYKDDFIKIAIEETSMFSRNIQATLGDVICFESPLKNSYAWISGNSELLNMKGSVGYVQSVLNGESKKVTVQHGASADFNMKYEVNLNYPDHLRFEKRSDIFNGQGYRALFTMSNHYQENTKKQRAVITNNLTACENLIEDFVVDFVTCRLTANDGSSRLFETRTIFDHSSGSYACEIQALVSLDEITSLSRSKSISFQLEARLSSGINDKVELKLNPAVQIFPANFNFEKLHKQELVITGMENILQKIELNSSHPDNLVLIPLPKTTSGKQSYKLRLNDASSVDDELFIQVDSPLTRQSVKIPIIPESYSEKLVNYSESWLTTIMSNVGKIIAIAVLVLTTIALVLMCQRNRELDTSGVFQTSARSSPNASPQQQQLQNQNVPPSFQQQQQTPLSSPYRNTSPIKLSSTGQYPESPIYGDTELSSPFRRYHKRAL